METIYLSKARARWRAKGLECEFYTLKRRGKKIGLKVYPHQSEADKIRRKQARAFKGKVGPAVLSKTLKVVDKKGFVEYGYLTELARVDGNRVYSEKELDDLDKRFRKVFKHSHDDSHEYNMGYLKGKLVYTDFGIM